MTLAIAIHERIIGTLRRECLDHVIVLGEGQLRRIIRSFLHYLMEPGLT